MFGGERAPGLGGRVRVRAGALKGQRLDAPGGSATRPTADRVRIACLDALEPYLGGGPFLDLFAGSGGIGIEALSRGAPLAVFVERDHLALRALYQNLARLDLTARVGVIRGDAARAVADLAREGRRFAAVFLDPPYASPHGASALAAIALGSALLPGAVVVVQHGSKAPPDGAPGVLTAWRSRRFGETTLTFFRGPA